MPALRLVEQEQPSMARTPGGEDPFAFEHKGYSQDSFYVRSTGPGGEQGEQKYLKMSPTILGAIAKVVYSKDIPAYRTDADFIRDAVVHRLKYVNDRIAAGDISGIIDTHVRNSRIEARQLELSETLHMINLHEETMRMAIENEDWELLNDLLDDAEHDVNNIRLTYANKLNVVIKKYRDRMPKGWNN